MSNSSVNTLSVGLEGKPYDVHIGASLLERCSGFIPFDLKGRSVFIITDKNVEKPYAGTLRNALEDAGIKDIHVLVLPAGEQTKKREQLYRVWDWLLDHNVNRHSVILALGGGVIGDLSGFAAATIMRGIDFVQIPTTLLAQVDSSVGGKTGINMPQGKNLVGAFHQPRCVLCDLDVLKTLPHRELLAGYAEIVKYALLGDPEFFIWLEHNGKDVCALDNDALSYAIQVSVRKKAEIVVADERESGQRALLNLGHTFAHVMEKATEYDARLLHGEAVAIGMVMAFHLSVRMGLCSQEDLDRVRGHLKSIGLPTSIADISPPLDGVPSFFVDMMKHDKKVTNNGLVFVVVNGIGRAHLSYDVPMVIVEEVITSSLQGK